MKPSDYLNDGNPIAMYGSGTAGRDIAAALTSAGYKVAFLLDRNACPHQTKHGYPVYSPEDPGLAEARGRTHVVVSIFNPFDDIPPILGKLKEDGWRSVTSIVQIYELLPELDRRYWLVASQYYGDKADLIESVANIWADEKSRELYKSVIEFRLTQNYDLLPRPEQPQYFAVDVPPWRLPLRLVDCGAFNGDTLRTIEELRIPIESIAAFEPDLSNYTALAAQRKSDYFKDREVTLWPCGVWDKTAQLRFSQGGGPSSSISETGDTVIQCVALDDALAGFRPTCIKMDIEGAEYDALRGAERIVHESRPGLAVCIYHYPNDIFRIPLLIRDWNLGYRFYLRTHGQSGFDLVLYAVNE